MFQNSPYLHPKILGTDICNTINSNSEAAGRLCLDALSTNVSEFRSGNNGMLRNDTKTVLGTHNS